jgi:hypothetical protein
MFAHQEDMDVVHSSQHLYDSSSYSRSEEYTGRQLVQGGVIEPHGVGIVQTSLPEVVSTKRVPDDRPLRIEVQSSASAVLLPGDRPGSTGIRLPVDTVGQHGSVRLSTNFVDLQGSTEDQPRELHSFADSSDVVEAELVSRPDAIDGGLSHTATSGPGSSANARDEGPVSQRSKSPVNCLDIVKQRFQKAGFSETVAHSASRGRRESTN